VQAIYIVAVNDVFVLKGWKKSLGVDESKSSIVHFLSDDAGAVRIPGNPFDTFPSLS
jgi:peroxiredoxin